MWWRVCTSITEVPWVSLSTPTAHSRRPAMLEKDTKQTESTDLHIKHSSSSIIIANSLMFIYFLLRVWVFPPPFLFSCPSNVHTAVLRFADSSNSFKSHDARNAGTLGSTLHAALHQHSNYTQSQGIPSPGLHIACVCVGLPLPPSAPPPHLLFHLLKCWLESFSTCWQSAQGLIYCVTVHK